MSSTKFRYIGVTDDCVTCQKCGKTELRNTVVLAILDADGNAEEVTYYGSSCAARALSIRGGSRAVLASARGALTRTADAARFAREMLAFYNLPEAGPADDAAITRAAVAYAGCNTGWAAGKTPAEIRDGVLDMLARRQAQVAEAVLVGA